MIAIAFTLTLGAVEIPISDWWAAFVPGLKWAGTIALGFVIPCLIMAWVEEMTNFLISEWADVCFIAFGVTTSILIRLTYTGAIVWT